MERSDLLKNLQSACRDFQAQFPTSSRAWLTAIISGTTEDDSTRVSKTDHIYELLCCFSLVGSLTRRVQNLRLICTTGKDGFRFPYSPGNKENFAFFRFEWNGDTYDLCCGTAVIPANSEPPEHPDISLQSKGRNVSDVDRTCGSLIALWDAKHHSKRSGKQDVQQMNWWCSIFRLPKYSSGDLLSQILPPIFQVSAVITNTDPIPLNRSMLLSNRFSVVFGFKGDTAGGSPTPCRRDHESQP